MSKCNVEGGLFSFHPNQDNALTYVESILPHTVLTEQSVVLFFCKHLTNGLRNNQRVKNIQHITAQWWRTDTGTRMTRHHLCVGVKCVVFYCLWTRWTKMFYV